MPTLCLYYLFTNSIVVKLGNNFKRQHLIAHSISFFFFFLLLLFLSAGFLQHNAERDVFEEMKAAKEEGSLDSILVRYLIT